MKEFYSFLLYALKSDKKIKNYLFLNVMGTVSQYCSLAMLFILIKIQVSGLENIINRFEYIRNYFSIKDDNKFIFVGVVVFLLFFFYIGYAYLSFLSKKSSTAIITLHKNKIILNAQKKHYWQKK